MMDDTSDNSSSELPTAADAPQEFSCGVEATPVEPAALEMDDATHAQLDERHAINKRFFEEHGDEDGLRFNDWVRDLRQPPKPAETALPVEPLPPDGGDNGDGPLAPPDTSRPENTREKDHFGATPVLTNDAPNAEPEGLSAEPHDPAHEIDPPEVDPPSPKPPPFQFPSPGRQGR